MRILDIIRKDITQILRDRKSALFLVIMPILFTVFFGLIFNAVFGSGNTKSDPRLPVGLINQDPGGLVSASLETLLPNSNVIRPVKLEGEREAQVNELVSKGELAAAVRAPVGYSQAISAGQPASLEVIADQGTLAGRTAVTALDTITGRLLGVVESAQLSAQAYSEQVGFQNEASRQTYFSEAFQEAAAAWKNPPLTVQIVPATGTDSQSSGNAGFTQSSPGMIVQFAIFGLISSGMILVLERKNGALQRLLTTPISRVEVIGGHILAMFLVVFFQEVLLVLLGQLVFGVDYLRQPGAVVLMMVSLALWAASLGLLISAISRKEEQVIAICLVVMFVFSAMGGSWFPLEVTGKVFSAIGHVLPTAWAMDGFQNLIIRGLDIRSVFLPAGLLLVYTLAFFGLAIWRFKFE